MALSLALLVVGPEIASGAEAESLEAARTAVAASRSEVERLVHRQSDLARSIDRIKREPGPHRDRLAELLGRTVQLESELESADERRRQAEVALARAIRTRIAAIDAGIEARVPALRSGPLEDRRAAARAIQRLRAERAVLREELGAMRPISTLRWGDHRVRVDPLDGPAELEEKADFVEDARDKVLAKRAALTELIARARQSERIASAAETFAAEARLFDEETRPGRVARGEGAETRSADAPEQGGSEAAPGSDGLGSAPGRDNGEASGPPSSPVELGLDTSNVFNRGVTEAAEPSGAPSGPGAAAPVGGGAGARALSGDAAVVARDLGRLLELDPERLDPSETTTQELEALLRALDRAEAELTRSAQKLRDQARLRRHE